MQTYDTLNAQLTGRNATRRKLGNNTYAHRVNGAIAIQLHSTDILTYYPDGRIVANSGGWKTVTTKARLNEFLPHGYQISQERGVWYWYCRGANWSNKGEVFTDGDEIMPNKEPRFQAKPADEKRQLKFRREVLAFARLCASKLPLPLPGAGDCFYCQMTVSEEKKGQSLGDAFKDFSHIQLHMDEGYVVPSMVLSAFKEKGCGDLIIATAFGKGMSDAQGFAGDYVKRAVAKFIFKRAGMVGK